MKHVGNGHFVNTCKNQLDYRKECDQATECKAGTLDDGRLFRHNTSTPVQFIRLEHTTKSGKRSSILIPIATGVSEAFCLESTTAHDRIGQFKRLSRWTTIRPHGGCPDSWVHPTGGEVTRRRGESGRGKRLIYYCRAKRIPHRRTARGARYNNEPALASRDLP